VQPSPVSNAVTTVHAGDTIQVELQETINHPGYFRVSLSADRASFTDPPLTNTTSCSLDLASVPTGAHDNVLMDGIAKSASAAANRHIMQDVKLPDQACDNCTLQVLQVMKDHGPPNCFYYHCAVLKILPADGTAAGSGAAAAGGTGAAGSAGRASGTAGSAGSAAGAAGSGGAAGVGTAAGSPAVAGSPGTAGSPGGGAGSSATGPTAGSTTPASSSKSGGCSVARLGGVRESARLPALVAIGACLILRRKRRQGWKL
jgi:hypothetical protein